MSSLCDDSAIVAIDRSDLMKGPATGCKDVCQKGFCSSDCGDDAVCTSIGLFMTMTIVGNIVSRVMEIVVGVGYFRYVFCESGVDGEDEQCCPGFGKLCVSKKVQKIIAAVWLGIGCAVMLSITNDEFGFIGESGGYGPMAFPLTIYVRGLSIILCSLPQNDACTCMSS